MWGWDTTDLMEEDVIAADPFIPLSLFLMEGAPCGTKVSMGSCVLSSGCGSYGVSMVVKIVLGQMIDILELLQWLVPDQWR